MTNKETKLKDKTTRKRRLTLSETGPLCINEKNKKDGFVRRFVDTSRPGRVAYLEKLGYSVVHDSDMKVGDDTVNNPGKLGSAVTVELGKYNGHKEGLLMEIPQEIYDEIQQEKEELYNQPLDESLGHTGVETQYGEIRIGNKTIK